jgi:hypothetical protein
MQVIGTLELTPYQPCIQDNEQANSTVELNREQVPVRYITWLTFVLNLRNITLHPSLLQDLKAHNITIVDHLDKDNIILTTVDKKLHMTMVQGYRPCLTSVAQRCTPIEGEHWYHTFIPQEIYIILHLRNTLHYLFPCSKVYYLLNTTPCLTIYIPNDYQILFLFNQGTNMISRLLDNMEKQRGIEQAVGEQQATKFNSTGYTRKEQNMHINTIDDTQDIRKLEHLNSIDR